MTKDAAAGRTVRSTTLDNGLRVLTETIPAAHSVAVGYWVRQGSAHEPGDRMGASHMLEHMVFKGTRARSQREIALSLESLGGHLDAYTTREHTAYQARVLDAHLPIAVDVLTDLTFHPRLDEKDLRLEREVVLEEIATVEDTPDDLVFDLHTERLWGDHGYGHRILGTTGTVNAFDTGVLRAVHAAAYAPANAVLCAVGSVDHDAIVRLAETHAGSLGAGVRRSSVDNAPTSDAGAHRIDRDSAQTHVVWGRTTVPHADPRRYPLIVLSQALGGGMSSRLFQRIREEEGLAYAVYAFQSFYETSGVEGVYVGTRPESAERAVEAVEEELDTIAREGLPEPELAQVREQVKGQMMLSMDSATARLYRLAGYALRGEDVRTPAEVLAEIDAVDGERIREVAVDFFDPAGFLRLELGPEHVTGG